MKVRLLFFVSIFCFSFICQSHAYKFTGSASRWPVIQNQSLVVSDTHAFVGDGDTLNVFDKETMERVAHLRLDHASEGFRALIYDPVRRYLYAACGFSGVQTINVDSPTNPVPGGKYLTSSQPEMDTDVLALDIALHDSYLFVADGNYSMRILDISEPSYPREVGFKNFASSPKNQLSPVKIGIYSTDYLTNVWAIILATTNDSRTFIARYKISGFNESTLKIDDTSSYTQLPSLLGVSSFIVEDDYAYCLDNVSNDIYVFYLNHEFLNALTEKELIKNGDPYLIFSQKTNQAYKYNPLQIVNPRGLFKLGDYLYVTNHGYWTEENEEPYGFVTLDFETLFDEDGNETVSPVLYGGKGVNLSGTNSIVVEEYSDEGGTAFVTSTYDGFIKVNPDQSATAETMINAHHISIEKENGFIYVCDNRATTEKEDHGITILRVKPEVLTEEDPDTGVETTTILRYSYPALPMRERFVSTPGTAKASCFTPDLYYSYVADGNEGIQVLSLTTDEVGGQDGPGHPTMIPGSNIPAPTGYEVFDVSVDELPVANATYLMALSSDPSGELWVVNVTEDTTEAEPYEYTPQTIDLDGDAAAQNVCAYHFKDNLYALVAKGSDGLTIIHLNPDWENPEDLELPPRENQIMHMDFTDARRVYVNNRNDYSSVNSTVNYAYVANGDDGVAIIRLFDETNLSEMNPTLVANIDTSASGSAIDVHIFANSVSRFLYVLTDNPYEAVLLYDISDIENPVFINSTATSGKSSGIFATEIMFTSSISITGSGIIRGVFIADGPGGVAFRGVEREAGNDDPDWSDDSTTFCFISASSGRDTHGHMLVFGLGFLFLGMFIYQAMLTGLFTKNQ